MKTFKRTHQTHTMMKPTNKNLFLLLTSLVLVLSMTFIACEGPTGPQGEQGLQGEQGQQGPQGEEGTANVIYSDWLSRPAMNDTTIALFADVSIGHIPAPELDQSIIDSGTIHIYARNASWGTRLLPIKEWGAGCFPSTTDFTVLEVGKISIFGYCEENDSAFTPSVLLTFRYVLIPDGVPAKIPAGFWEDYEAVAAYYGIPD